VRRIPLRHEGSPPCPPSEHLHYLTVSQVRPRTHVFMEIHLLDAVNESIPSSLIRAVNICSSARFCLHSQHARQINPGL